MAIGYNSNHIFAKGKKDDLSKDGLLINVDATDLYSYPGSGTTWKDLSGNSNNLTLVNGPAYSASDEAMSFDGSNDYASIARPAELPSGRTFSLCLWAKWTTTGTSVSEIQALVDNNHSVGNGFIIQDRPDLAGKPLTFAVTGGAASTWAQSTTQVGDGTWHHIVATWDGTNARLYIDGKLDASIAQTNSTYQSNIFLGSNNGTGRFLNGKIGQFQLYNRAITSDEVKTNYNATKGRFVSQTNLVLKIDAGNTASYSGSGATWTDLSSQANNVTLAGSPVFSSLCKGSIIIDGVNDVGTLDVTKLPTGNSDRTIIAFVKTPSALTGGYKSVIHYGATTTGGSFGINLWNNTNWGVNTSGGTGQWSDNGLNTSTNYCLAISYEHSKTAVKFYQNGQFVKKTSSTITTGTANGAKIGAGLGASYGEAWGPDGKIYAVIVYSRRLTDAEIQAIYSAYSPRFLDIDSSGLVLNVNPLSSACYPGYGNSVKDLSASGVTGTLTNGTSYLPNKKALWFDGVDDYVDLGNTSLGIASGASAITVSSWVKASNFNNFNAILARTNANGAGPIANPYGGWQLNTNSTSCFDFAVNVSGTWTSWQSLGGSFDVTNKPVADNWYHVVGVFDGSTIKLYVDGKLISSYAASGTIQYASNLGNLIIGKNGSGYFKGQIGQTLVYNRALASDEIANLYSNTVGNYKIPIRKPNEISGLGVWLRSDVGVLDANGVAITADNTAVATWQDQSGNGRHVTQATVSKQPVWRSGANGTNNVPAISWDGTSKSLAGAYPALGTQQTIFCVAKFADIANTYWAFDMGSNLNGTNNAFRLGLTHTLLTNCTGRVGFTTSGGIYYSTAPCVPKTQVFTMNCYVSGSVVDNTYFKVNGDYEILQNQVNNYGAAYATFTNQGGYTVGSRTGDDSASCMKGEIYELIVYPRKLTAQEMVEVETYLKLKYNIQAFVPTDINTSAVSVCNWYDANSGVLDGNGNSASLNSTVGTWQDLSGNSRHATQTTDANRPLFVRNSSLNLMPGLQFDGTDDLLNMTNSGGCIRNKAYAGIFTVVHNPSRPGGNPEEMIINYGTPTTGETRFGLSACAAGVNYPQARGKRLDAHSTVSANTYFYWQNYPILYSGQMIPAATSYLQMSYSGENTLNVGQSWATEAYSFSANLTGTGSTSDTDGVDNFIGRGPTGATNFFGGLVHEIVTVSGSSKLTFKDKQKIEGYLSHKWGISQNLAWGHPYRLAPPWSTPGLTKTDTRDAQAFSILNNSVLNIDASDKKCYIGTGTSVTNLSNTSQTGTLTNGPTWQDSYVSTGGTGVGGHFVFDGTNDFILGNSNLGISGNAEFTISAWFNMAALPTDWAALFFNDGGTTDNTGLILNLNAGRPAIDFWNNRWRATNALSTNTWYHIVVTKTPGAIASTSKIYVNGVEVAAALEGTDATPNITNGPWVIGRAGAVAGRYLNGRVAQLCVTNRALTHSEILNMFNYQRPKFRV